MIVRASVVLPQPDSPTERERLALAHVEVHAVDRARRALAARVVHVEVAHLESGVPLVHVATGAPATCTHAASRSSPAGHSSTGVLRADVDRHRAARVERAAARQVARVGRIAGQARRVHPELGSPITGNAAASARV